MDIEKRRAQKRECEARRRARMTLEEREEHNRRIREMATPEDRAKRAAHQKVYYSNLSDEQRARRKEKAESWNKSHPGANTERERKWRENNRDRACKNSRSNSLLRKYKMTADQFNQMLFAQEGKCAICRTDTPMGTFNQWHVDHCHISGEVRAILCYKCNVGLGKFNDDPALVQAAADYLIRYSRR
jgi:glucose-6-phosphate isomerase